MSLKNEITGEIIANSLCMDTYDEFYVLVEGETDELFYSKFLDNTKCTIEICQGKQNVIDAISILNNRNKRIKYFGIIDKDYEFLISTQEVDNIIKTDYHSVETMCLKSSSFENLVKEYFDSNKIDKLNTNGDFNLVEHILELTKQIAQIRMLSINEKYYFQFKPTGKQSKELDYTKFICKNTFSYLGLDNLLDTVKKYHNQGVHLSNKDLISKIKELDSDKYEILDICHGHDISRVIVVGMKKAIGKNSLVNTNVDEIERAMRLTYSREDFYKTEIKKKIEIISKELIK